LSCLDSGNAVEGEAGRANEGGFVRQDGHCSEVEKAFLCDQGLCPKSWTYCVACHACARVEGTWLLQRSFFSRKKVGAEALTGWKGLAVPTVGAAKR
jgi:hypothetical protein